MKNLLRALFSKAAPKTPDKQSQTADIVKNRTTHEHPSKGLTPQSLHRILEDAENGDIQAQSELFVDIEEKDGHIFSEMSKRKRAVIGLDWNIVPPPNSSEAERKLAEEVDGWLNQMTDLEDMMFDLLDAVGHGFSCVEIEWEYLGSLWLPKAFHHRPQAWFKWTQRAKDMIDSGEYRYLSPVLEYDTLGNVRGLHSVALTNSPALDGMALAALSRQNSINPKQETSMNKEALIKLLGLAADADDKAIEAALAEAQEKLGGKTLAEALAEHKDEPQGGKGDAGKPEDNPQGGNAEDSEVAELKADCAR